MANWVLTSVSSRLKLGFFLLVLGFGVATAGSLFANLNPWIETKALVITAAVCLVIAITAAGVGVHLDEARGHPVPKVIAGVFGFLGCIFFIAAAALRIDWHRNNNRLFPNTDYPCALMILGAIFALVGAIFCFFDLAKVRLNQSDSTTVRSGEVRVHRARDTDGDGRIDKVETKTYTVNE